MVRLYIDHLRAGAKVYLHKRGDTTGAGILTRVELMKPEKHEVYVYAPKVNGHPVNLTSDEQYYFRLVTECSIFRYRVKFLTHGEIDGFDISCFKLLDGGEKSQRREAYRFNLNTMVIFSVVYTDGNQSEKIDGMIVDLSAGGAKIYSDRKVSKGEFIIIDLMLDDDQIIVFGDVRTANDLPPKSRFAYQYGVRFAMMAESDQERIIRFMYKKQREELKKANSRRM